MYNVHANTCTLYSLTVMVLECKYIVQDTSGDAAKCRTLATYMYGSDIYMYNVHVICDNK